VRGKGVDPLAARRELRLGHARILLIEGDPIDHPSSAMYTSGNARGIMASGMAGAIRLSGGAEIERELRSHPHLLVGVAYLTGSGRLVDRGVNHIVHGISTPQPGTPSKRAALEAALTSGLQRLNDVGEQSLTLPEIGTRLPNIELTEAADLCVGIIGSHLRRSNSPEQITIAGRHLAYLRRCRDRFIEMGATVE
jgi:O-acetyl-ADP-ribose deacetylase (regulator of RNase III)